MMSLIRWTLAPALATAWLLLCGSANAQTRGRTVQDDARLFSKQALTKANAEIARIKSQFNKDLIIETVPKAPGRPEDLDVKNQKAVDHFFDDWAVQRAKRLQGNDIYVVFVHDPKWKTVRVAVDKNTDKAGLFSRVHGEELRSTIVAHMKANDADGALVTATEFVFDTMQRNSRPVAQANPNPLPAAQPQAEGIPWLKYVLIGIGVVFVLWLVMAVVRGFSGTGSAAQPGYGGGGFMNGFLGGLFGAAAGMWMYNTFFGGQSSSAWASPPNAGPSSTDPGAAGDYYVSGGDYGNDKTEPGLGGGGNADDAGGGDWGGGGGGDWGGDWGGGGGGDW